MEPASARAPAADHAAALMTKLAAAPLFGRPSDRLALIPAPVTAALPAKLDGSEAHVCCARANGVHTQPLRGFDGTAAAGATAMLAGKKASDAGLPAQAAKHGSEAAVDCTLNAVTRALPAHSALPSALEQPWTCKHA